MKKSCSFTAVKLVNISKARPLHVTPRHPQRAADSLITQTPVRRKGHGANEAVMPQCRHQTGLVGTLNSSCLDERTLRLCAKSGLQSWLTSQQYSPSPVLSRDFGPAVSRNSFTLEVPQSGITGLILLSMVCVLDLGNPRHSLN